MSGRNTGASPGDIGPPISHNVGFNTSVPDLYYVCHSRPLRGRPPAQQHQEQQYQQFPRPQQPQGSIRRHVQLGQSQVQSRVRQPHVQPQAQPHVQGPQIQPPSQPQEQLHAQLYGQRYPYAYPHQHPQWQPHHCPAPSNASTYSANSASSTQKQPPIHYFVPSVPDYPQLQQQHRRWLLSPISRQHPPFLPTHHRNKLHPVPPVSPVPHPPPSTSGTRRSMPVRLESLFGSEARRKRNMWLYGEVQVKPETLLGCWSWGRNGGCKWTER